VNSGPLVTSALSLTGHDVPEPGSLAAQIGIAGAARIDHAEARRRQTRSMAFRDAVDGRAREPITSRARRSRSAGAGIRSWTPSPELLELIAAGAKVCAVNKTHDLLVDHGHHSDASGSCPTRRISWPGT
jgi:hypothetical protein